MYVRGRLGGISITGIIVIICRFTRCTLKIKGNDYKLYIVNECMLCYYRLLYKKNTTFYDPGHVSGALLSLRGNALPRHGQGHKMLYLCNNIIIYPYKINQDHADT